jgi:hypothetical protein
LGAAVLLEAQRALPPGLVGGGPQWIRHRHGIGMRALAGADCAQADLLGATGVLSVWRRRNMRSRT